MSAREPKPIDTEFWKRVDKGDEDWHCWEWTGSMTGNGYGRITHNYEKQLSHRLSYRLHCCQPIEPEAVMHLCDNRCCVNPLHLRGGDRRENRIDCVRKGRHAKTFSPGNGVTKLSALDVEEIRARALAGETHRALADEFSVSYGHVGSIRRGERRSRVR